jgi:hypothetical protein
VKQLFVLAGSLVLTPACALAQVTVNSAALQQLAGIVPPPAVVTTMAAPMHHWTHHAVPAPAKPAAPVQQATAQVTTHVIHVPGPPAPAPKLPASPAPPMPPANVTLIFATGSSNLSPTAIEALKPFCTSHGVVSVNARAPAVASDPSAAMRLSLARAFAVKDALTACGVPPQNILPRAQGAVPGQNENITVIGSGIR